MTDGARDASWMYSLQLKPRKSAQEHRHSHRVPAFLVPHSDSSSDEVHPPSRITGYWIRPESGRLYSNPSSTQALSTTWPLKVPSALRYRAYTWVLLAGTATFVDGEFSQHIPTASRNLLGRPPARELSEITDLESLSDPYLGLMGNGTALACKR
ncbi:hypothetical protein B0O99DRAFT_601880 [Bisporella sp. PMI_857]|nr:hypothetical protein B0O99DRAFT_601880 [Bisporella sp. PMI_857]